MTFKIVGTGSVIHGITIYDKEGTHGTLAFPIDFESTTGKMPPIEKIEAALKQKLEGMTFELDD
jgi:hypothetical protein